MNRTASPTESTNDTILLSESDQNRVRIGSEFGQHFGQNRVRIGSALGSESGQNRVRIVSESGQTAVSIGSELSSNLLTVT